MRAQSIVRQIGKGCRDQIHPARFRAFAEVVEAATRSKRLTLTALGGAVRSTALVRHRIKKVDRLLGNTKLQKERLYWFKALIARLARGQRRLIVLVDWTQIRGDFWALVASVPFGGRSIPIFAQAYEHDQLGAAEAHLAFLNELRQIVPRDCRAVIIADGGFRSPFFRACEAVGMDFVIRLRNQKSVAMFEWGVRVKFAKLFERATTIAQCLGDGRPYVTRACPTFHAPAPPRSTPHVHAARLRHTPPHPAPAPRARSTRMPHAPEPRSRAKPSHCVPRAHLSLNHETAIGLT